MRCLIDRLILLNTGHRIVKNRNSMKAQLAPYTSQETKSKMTNSTPIGSGANPVQLLPFTTLILPLKLLLLILRHGSPISLIIIGVDVLGSSTVAASVLGDDHTTYRSSLSLTHNVHYIYSHYYSMCLNLQTPQPALITEQYQLHISCANLG